MDVRTLWKGVIHMGKHHVPVRLYAAAKDHTVHFRLLHKKDKQPVQQRMVHPETGEEVPTEDQKKAAEVEAGLFVVLDEDDLKELEPESSRTMLVERFVPDSALSHTWYDSPYFLGPDGDEGPHAALVKALEDSGQEGIVRWVMRKKEYVGSLFAHEGHLVLVKLRFADQVVLPEDVTVSFSGKIAKNELEMARRLMGMLESRFDAGRYRDEFHDRVLDMIEKKAKGRTVRPKKPGRKNRPSSLATALKASLTQTRKAGRKTHA